MKENNEEKLLNDIIQNFYEDKQNLNVFKKLTEKANEEIKMLMNKANKNEFETDNGLVAKITIQKRETFIDELLLQKIKELKIDGIIQTKEYVDMDALENAIYNGKLNASELANCRQIKEVQTLKISKKKEN